MKEFILGFILLFNAFQASSQTYIPMPTDTAMWRCRFTVQTGTSYFDTWEYLYFLNGEDTIVNSKTYKKVILRYHYYGSGTSTPPPTSSNPFVADTTDVICGMRETNKKVYGFGYSCPPFFSDTVEELLYDFNLNLGDTSHVPTAGNAILSNIDSTLIGGSYRKKLFFTLGWHSPENIIEGIGSTLGIKPCGGASIHWVSELLCFSYKNTILYTDSNNICSYIYPYGSPVNIPQTQTISSNIKISPNPFINSINIQTLIPIHVIIYNSLGLEVIDKKIITDNSIDANHIAPGIYLLVIRNNSGEIIKKEKIIKE